MSSTEELIPTSNAGWIELYKKLGESIGPHPKPPTKRLLIIMSLLCPVSAILYIISAIKRSKDTGPWLVKFDRNGYLRPNAYILVPLFVVLYTAVNLASLITFQIDESSYFKAHTLVLHLTTFPILVCLAWTKLWSVLYSMPPSKYGLLKRQGPSSSQRKELSPRIFNALALFVYVSPFMATMPMILLTIDPVRDGRRVWLNLSKSIRVISDQDSSDPTKTISEMRVLEDVKTINQCERKILILIRSIAGCFIFFDAFLLLVYIYAHFRILRVLLFQINVLKECSKRRRAIMLDYCARIPKELDECSSNNHCSQTDSSRKAGSSETKVSTHYSTRSRYRVRSSFTRWRDWLPNLAQGTAVSGSVWNSSLFTRGKQEWEALDEIILLEQSEILKSYTANTFWQAILAFMVGLSYLILDWMVVTNRFRVPESHTLVELNYFIIEWSNISWNLGIGILLGTISCIVAYSPKPSLPEEPTERIEDYESE